MLLFMYTNLRIDHLSLQNEYVAFSDVYYIGNNHCRCTAISPTRQLISRLVAFMNRQIEKIITAAIQWQRA